MLDMDFRLALTKRAKGGERCPKISCLEEPEAIKVQGIVRRGMRSKRDRRSLSISHPKEQKKAAGVQTTR